MTNNKAYNIMTLCKLRGIDRDSEEAEDMKNWTVLQLLNAIQEARNSSTEDPEEEIDISLTRRIGCEHR
jgi:hypothetical protein|tara:strand:+ start:599 stop:805 length:207 start_codon:yes stop_codon:yes gene_type:complete